MRKYPGILPNFLFLMIFSQITSGSAYSQKIEIINSGFEERDTISGKMLKGWLPATDEREVFIPAGTEFASLAKKDSEAGIIMLVADTIPHTGKYCLSLKIGKSAVQTLSHEIFQGRQYTLTFYARSKNSTAILNAKLYYLGGYGREQLASSFIDLSDQYKQFTLKYRAIVPESYGYNIGIQFENYSKSDVSVLVDDVSLAALENQ